MRIALALLLGTAAVAQDRSIATEAVPGSLQFSADGRSITALSRDNRLRTWDVASGKELSARTVPAGTQLAGTGRYLERTNDKGVRVWDLTAERQLYLLSGASGNRLALSPDGKHLASSRNDDLTTRLFDNATGQQRHALADGIGGTAAMAFSPDGQTLVSANYDNDVRIWKTQSGELVKKIEDLTGAMFAAEFSPDGRQLMMGGLDETIYVWDARTFALTRKLQGHGETIAALAISPDGRTLVTGGFDVRTVANPVKVVFWDIASGKILRTESSPHRVVSLAFSPDSKWVALTAGDKSIALWRVPAAQ